MGERVKHEPEIRELRRRADLDTKTDRQMLPAAKAFIAPVESLLGRELTVEEIRELANPSSGDDAL